MRGLLGLVGVALLLAGCLKTTPPADVTGFVDAAGKLAGAAEYCDPVLAARATACARNVVATWPGGLGDGERRAALERLDVVRQGAANQPQSCPAKVESLRSHSFWERCYYSPSTVRELPPADRREPQGQRVQVHPGRQAQHIDLHPLARGDDQA